MTRVPALVVMALLAGCEGFYKLDGAPAANFPSVCEDQVYSDPTVRDLIAKSAGSGDFAHNNLENLRRAKLDAARRCEVQRGIAPPGGGVERPRAN